MTHHFALSVPDEDILITWRDTLNQTGVPTTDVKDRAYFKSIYFHDPDGQVVEIATDSPGFTADEATPILGHGLQLPPWLENQRNEIERHLPPLTVPDPIGR